jgi:hypothetical protein
MAADKYYYEAHVCPDNSGKANGYSVGLISSNMLEDDEVIEELAKSKAFEEDTDRYCVDGVYELTETEYYQSYE